MFFLLLEDDGLEFPLRAFDGSHSSGEIVPALIS